MVQRSSDGITNKYSDFNGCKTLLIKGLYLITPEDIDDPNILSDLCHAALSGGAKIIQFRKLNQSNTEHIEKLGAIVVDACKYYKAISIINNDPLLALNLGASGCHLGQTDLSLKQARALIGEKLLIGKTCHGSRRLTHEAILNGADYCAFGRLFPSFTKTEAPYLSLNRLSNLVDICDKPTVAIGGISLKTLPLVLSSGVDAIAVSHYIFNSKNIEILTKQFIEEIEKYT